MICAQIVSQPNLSYTSMLQNYGNIIIITLVNLIISKGLHVMVLMSLKKYEISNFWVFR